MKKIFFIISVVIFQNAFACSLPSLDINISISKLVFAGEVVETKTIAGPWFEGTKKLRQLSVQKLKSLQFIKGTILI